MSPEHSRQPSRSESTACATASRPRPQRQCSDDDLRSDAARLLHLTYRFAFDFETAARYLDEAAERYLACGNVVGIANVSTNRAEQLAWTAPQQAVGAARRAIEQQSEVGALPEVGKSRTALALAHIRLGELTGAERELEAACADLDRARYRSGRARAELFRAALFAKLGHLPEMITSVTWAVQEFEAADGYPTMIIGAATALQRVGNPLAEVTAAADRAWYRIKGLEPTTMMQRRIDQWMSVLVADLR